MKKLKEQRNRNETGLKQKYMKLANLRRILGDALLNNFQVNNDGLKQKYMKLANLRRILGDALLNNFQVGKRRAVRYKIGPPARQCCGFESVVFLNVFGPAGSGSVSLMYGSRSAPDQDPSIIKQK